DERGTLQLLDDVRHRERLPRAGDSQQHLVAFLRTDAANQPLDRLGLIAGRLEVADQLEWGHTREMSNDEYLWLMKANSQLSRSGKRRQCGRSAPGSTDFKQAGVISAIGVAAFFFAHGRRIAVARIHDRVVRQCEQFLADPAHEQLLTPTGEIAAADASLEQD